VAGGLDHGYRARFLALARRRGASDAQAEADRLLTEARAAAPHGAAHAGALAELFWREAASLPATTTTSAGADAAGADAERSPRFLCDPSLAGLARWLRAAGFEADVGSGVPGHRLPDEALRLGRVLLTTDADALDRRIVAQGALAVVWVPSALTMCEQLRMVAFDLGLAAREPRCMRCGGTLAAAAKEAVRPRIPPRTALWRDDYFLCLSCGGLFWQGTHWERIARALEEAVGR
jgi:uncharacterized protein with PIN domain